MGRSIAAVVIGCVVSGVLAINVAGSIATWTMYPAWYHVVALVLVMPSAWLGGRLRERELGRRAAPTSALAA